MIFTSLQLFNTGIWEQSWHIDVNTSRIIGRTSPKVIDYANIGTYNFNNTLHELTLHGRLTEYIRLVRVRVRVGFQLLCDKINENVSIKKINFHRLHSSHIKLFCQLLTPSFVRNSLQEISLSECELSEGEEHLLATALANRETPLNTLTFQSNTIIKLAMAFYENPGLFPKKLNAELSTNFIGKVECESIAHILQD